MTRSRVERSRALEIGGEVVSPGSRLRFDLPAALLPTHTRLHIPLTVVNGLEPGPVVWISAAVHGDELNGVEVIHRLLARLPDPLRRGAIIAAPIVNVFGFIGQSRYLPDRRDLNRSFPGSTTGSLAGRIANLFMREVVERSTYGIDLHTGSQEKTNLPQIRADLKDPETRRIAEAFRAPVMMQSTARSGSLRAAATKRGIPTVVYEGGESQRFNETAIDLGVRGVLGVLRELRMHTRGKRTKAIQSIALQESSWVRARRGGLLRLRVKLGEVVQPKEEMGTISDPFGEESVPVRAPYHGLVVGKTNNPVVHGGDAVVHLGKLA